MQKIEEPRILESLFTNRFTFFQSNYKMTGQCNKLVQKNSIFGDFCRYFISSPKINTLVRFTNLEEKEKYTKSIMQRVGIKVDGYNVLNIHQIGIDVPCRYVFEDLLNWDGKSNFWPNSLAQVKKINNELEDIYIYFLGIEKIVIPWFKKIEIKVTPLFNLSSIRFQLVPSPQDADNARYLLYNCRGGYPIGIFCLYVRSSIIERNEKSQSQLFSLVAFDFYGRKNRLYNSLLNPLWKKIHNRAMANIMNRIKISFEEKFEQNNGKS